MIKEFRELPIWQQWLWVSAVGGTTLELLLMVIVADPDVVELALPVVFVGQWQILRGRVRGAGWWLLVSPLFGFTGIAMGGVFGGRLQDAIDGVLSSPEGIASLGPGRTILGSLAAVALGGVLMGAILGFGQWLVLRRTLKRAGWWILAVLAGFIIGSLLDMLLLAAGIASSLALKWLWEEEYREALTQPRTEPRMKFGWQFYVQWVWLTTLAFGVGSKIINFIDYDGTQTNESVTNVAAWFFSGASVGAVQYFLLRRKIGVSWWWVVATATGWGLGVRLFLPGLATLNGLLPAVLGSAGTDFSLRLSEWQHSGYFDNLFGGAVVGAIIGALQWILLRREGTGAAWWILATAGGWAATYTLTAGTGPILLRTNLEFGVITGSLTGIVLMRLLRNRGRRIQEQMQA